MINRLLVANRGEIARRIFRTCRDLGIGTVAVYSDPDGDAPHARAADLAVRLSGAAPSDTYLRGDLLIDAARKAGADAVHPGYGFLSEQAEFASAVLDAGLTWVGPPPAAIEATGDKVAAKKLMAAAGVPVLPELDPGAVTADDLPLMVKAAAGGGGRGMRIVRSPAELSEAVASARREAQAAFGDPTVFCEPLLEGARHIEVQVLADTHGTVWTLGERECSIQRRHQKILEETPSPAVDAALRTRLCEAAADAARAIGYTGAGTVEFLLDAAGRFFFLEVNTRLQVEHPVTECVYGIDLVRLQLEVAEGARLAPEAPPRKGHAIEVRLYAEDPAQAWRPASGTLHAFEFHGVDTEFASHGGDRGLRLDSGVVNGSEVGVHYDPMLAKLISWAPTREAAARRLRTALAGARIHGVTTNRDLLARVLADPAFLAGDTDTGYLERPEAAELFQPLAGPAAVRLSALAAALADATARRVHGGLQSGWRNLRSQPQQRSYEGPDGRIDVAYFHDRQGWQAEGYEARIVSAAQDEVVLEDEGVRTRFAIRRKDDEVFAHSPLGPVTLRALPRFEEASAQVAPGSLLAPMPGTVVRVDVEQGATVAQGQPMVVLEAMKMEHRIAAPASGTVDELNVRRGQQVDAGTVLAVIRAPRR